MKIKYSISHTEKMISHTTEQMIPRMVITKMHIFQNINHIASSTTISGLCKRRRFWLKTNEFRHYQ